MLLLRFQNLAEVGDERVEVQVSVEIARVIARGDVDVVDGDLAEFDSSGLEGQGDVTKAESQATPVGKVESTLDVLAVLGRGNLKTQVLDTKAMKLVQAGKLNRLVESRMRLQRS